VILRYFGKAFSYLPVCPYLFPHDTGANTVTMLGRGNNRAIREVNRSIILDLLRRGDRISRTELARRSKLTKPTVSTIVDEFITTGVVREVGLGESLSGGGRPAMLLEFDDTSAAYLGIHFGVRATRVALADARGNIRLVRDRPSLRETPERAAKTARALVVEVLQAAKIPRARVAAVGATVPGLVDQDTGVCVLAPNLGWKDFPLRETLQNELRVPVIVNNITQASALAEGRLGAARGKLSYVWVYVGSGMGAGIVIDGQIFHGQRGFSGEIGHCPVVEDGPLCGCGRRGCLETVASTMALVKAAKTAIAGKSSTILSKTKGEIDIAAITAAASKNDKVAMRILDQASEYLGRGLSYLLNILNPEMIVLGGPVAQAGDYLLREVRASVARHALLPHGVAIVPSTLGDRAELAGAVLLAMESTVRSYRIVDGARAR
jgi:glucokinase-like ROK family protein